MADNLYAPGAQLLAEAGGTNSKTAQQGVERENQVRTESNEIGKQNSDMRLQKDQQQASENIEKLKTKMGYVTLTAPVAIGLAKHSKNPAWLKAVGTEMPVDQLIALYTAETQASAREQRPKMVTRQEGNNLQQGWSWIDDDGSPVFAPIGSGGPKFNPAAGKGGKGGSGGGASGDLQEKKAWLKEYDDIQKRYEGIKGEVAKGATDPDKKLQYQKDQAFLSDNRSKHDKIMQELAAGGGSGPGAASKPAAGGGGDNFDAHKFIDDALENSGL